LRGNLKTPNASFRVVDVTDPVQVEKAIASIESEIGPVSVLINSVGINDSIGPLWTCDPAEWWNDVEVNLRGTFNPCYSVSKRMVARSAGRIVNLSSGAGNFPMPTASSYSVAKAGVQRLTESLAISLKPFGVFAFAVSPGSVRTALTEKIIGSKAGRRWLPELCNLSAENWTAASAVGDFVVEIASGRIDCLTGRFISIRDDLDLLVEAAATIQEQDKLVLRLRA